VTRWFANRVLSTLFALALLQFAVRPAPVHAQQVGVESIYTRLSGNECRQLQQDPETGAAKDECRGVDGLRLILLNDDNRASVTVITPENKVFPLQYWDVVTHSFSNLGAKAEWRVVREGSKTRPIALIVRVEFMDQSNVAAPRKKSVLSVAKITPESICVVQNVTNDADANARARVAADNAADKPCLVPKP
jgi:hypothetical protein